MTSNNQDRFAAGTSASARAAPAVRSLAKKLGVDLEKCVGTGRDGMITMNDVIARTNQAGRARRETENAAQNRPNQPSRRPGPEPVRAQAPAPQPSRPTTPPRGWTNEPQQSEPSVPTLSNQPPVPSPVPRDPVRIPPRMQPSAPAPAQAWGTVEEEELPTEQPEPRIVASRLQDLSSYDFPSAERQPDASESDPNAPPTSWFATTETTGYQATMVPVQPDPVPAQALNSIGAPINPWGAVEDADERDESSGDQAAYPSEYETEADALQADDGSRGEEQAEEYVELASDELEASPSAEAADQAAESDWEEPLDAGSELAEDSSQYAQDFEPEAQDAAVMTTAYEASSSSAAVQSDLTSEEWAESAPPAPEVPADWVQPGVPGYANTASTGAEARTTSLRAPNLDITPRPLVDQEDRLHGLRRNMALNTTRARDEVATCTMFDDADLNAWPNFADITVRLLRAITAGIHAEPGFNATFDPAGPSRRLLRQINVAVAVDTREGLTMPVLRDVGSRSIEDLREYVYYMKERTRTRTLAPEDLRDFSFTLANYGIFAGRYATPLVLPPTVATLGCGRLERAVVAGESVPEIHALLPLSLTFDHRCVTMGEACRFLAALKQDLELAE